MSSIENLNYKKDSSGMIINNDIQEYQKKKAARENIKKIHDVCKRMDILEKELKTVKYLLLEELNQGKHLKCQD
jgi:hypothetical protein